MPKNHGLTLIQLMVGIAGAAVAVVVAVTFVTSCGEWRGTAEHAEAAARTHADKLGWKVKGIACTGADTDADGYISCTLVLEGGSERALECASGGMRDTQGCKKAPMDVHIEADDL